MENQTHLGKTKVPERFCPPGLSLYSYLLQHFLYPAWYTGTGSNKLQLHSRQLRKPQSLYSSAHFLLDFGKLLFVALKNTVTKSSPEYLSTSPLPAATSRSTPCNLAKHIISSPMSEILVNPFKVLNICKHKSCCIVHSYSASPHNSVYYKLRLPGLYKPSPYESSQMTRSHP